MVKERTASQKGRHSRTKGHSYEREIVNKLKPLFPNAKRHLESQAVEALKGIDLEHTGALKIQCKRLKNYAPINKLEEVNVSGIPVLVTKGDRKKDVVCLYLDDFIKILEDIGIVYDS